MVACVHRIAVPNSGRCIIRRRERHDAFASIARPGRIGALRGRRARVRSGAGRRDLARRQGDRRAVRFHAARYRHREGVFRQARVEHRENRFRRQRQAAAGAGGRTRSISGSARGRNCRSSPRATPISASPPLPVRPTGWCWSCAPTRRIDKVADLKGKKISVSTVGGLTDWMVHEVSRQQGWGPDGIDVIAARHRRGAGRGDAHQADRRAWRSTSPRRASSRRRASGAS